MSDLVHAYTAVPETGYEATAGEWFAANGAEVRSSVALADDAAHLDQGLVPLPMMAVDDPVSRAYVAALAAACKDKPTVMSPPAFFCIVGAFVKAIGPEHSDVHLANLRDVVVPQSFRLYKDFLVGWAAAHHPDPKKTSTRSWETATSAWIEFTCQHAGPVATAAWPVLRDLAAPMAPPEEQTTEDSTSVVATTSVSKRGRKRKGM
jgi:hypothetical protein